MTRNAKNQFKVLVLGHLWELDNIFGQKVFRQTYPVETIHVTELDDFQEAIEDPDIDLIVIDIEPYGLDVLDIVLDISPMRAVIMVADPEQASTILEAKKAGLERYVLRVDDDQINIDLLSEEIYSVLSQLRQAPSLTHPTVEDLFRYAQYHNIRQPFLIVDRHRRLIYINKTGRQLLTALHGREIAFGDKVTFIDRKIDEFSAHLDTAFERREVEVQQRFNSLPEREKYRQLLFQPVPEAGDDVVAVSIAFRNVGEQRIVEEKFERREESLWAYFDMVPLPLKVVDSDLKIQSCNPAFCDLLHYETCEHMTGQGIDRFVYPDDLDEVQDALESIFAGTDDYFQAEHRYCDEDGSIVWANHIGFAISDHQGEPDRVLVIAVDVTRQKQVEQRAEQSMRLEAIGELSSGIAHDFNNVLSIVTAVAHLLKEELARYPESELLTYVDKIDSAAESGASLTRQLLSFGQRGESDRRPTDLNERVQKVAKLLDRTMGEDLEMQLELAPDPGIITIGDGQIDQVLMNLAVNARDAMDGGTLRISTDHLDVTLDSPAPWPDLESGEWVVLEVTDTGIGMNQDTQRRIFEPFYTTKDPGEGTGMGLATVYRIVDNAGGKIYLDSVPGEGTTFTICFPKTAGAVDIAASSAPPAEQDKSRPSHTGASDRSERKPTVLVLEDEEGIREPYRIFLENRGYRVLEAEDIAQAREVAAAHIDSIDLLLADVILPDGSGVELAKELCDERSALKIIFMSGYAPDLIYQDEDDFDHEWGFLPKPINRTELLDAVDQALQGPEEPTGGHEARR